MALFKTDAQYIAAVVATFWFVSIPMTYLNRVFMPLISNEDVSISAPFFVTWFQCVITAGICWVAGEFTDRMKKNQEQYAQILIEDSDNSNSTDATKKFPKAKYNVGQGLKRVFPLSVVFVGAITFNHLISLKWVEVSFYNVARSLIIVFIAFLSSVMLGSISQKTMGCLAIVILGIFMGSTGELNSLSLKGTIVGIASTLFVSLNPIYTKKILPVVDNDHWKLIFYNNINACILFIPLILIFEHKPIAAAFGDQFFSGVFWTAMLVSSFFGCLIEIVTVLQIKATSPLTGIISGNAKGAVQSIVAFFIWKNKPTFMSFLGIFTVLGGSLLYMFVKIDENRNNTKQASKPEPEERDVEMNTLLEAGVN